ncbi:MAG: hypothetical protein IKK37_06270 [Clostridia bacterium]|nr:hypothetical protein [Clostridia bacterium]
MDRELRKMQDQADCFSHVYLRRTHMPSAPKEKAKPKNDDSLLLLGLILILLVDGSDMLTVFMLLYILGT